MTKFELLSDAQSEQVSGGVYFGANYNSISLGNIGSAWAVGGESNSLLGGGNASAIATNRQANAATLYNVVLSLF